MYTRFLKIMVVAAMLFVAYGLASANRQEAQQTTAAEIDCSRCHTCETPTTHDVCLKPCYRHTARSQSSGHELDEAPDSVLLDVLAEEYLPILFDHKPHAEMAGMSDNCSSCHHYSPKGEIPPCRSCHPKDAADASSAQPDLRTAYHRQCLVCHSQWAHEALCDVCHPESAADAPKSLFVRGTVPMTTVNVPVSKVYKTGYGSAPLVTFQHVEHIELFEFECVDCHQHENCRYCHDQVKREDLNKPMTQIHGICSGCHEIGDELSSANGCGECHDRQERPAMFHSIIGYNLPKYLENTGCDGCHPDRGAQVGVKKM